MSPQGKRTNLRKPGSERIDHSMRVKFNPLALLLDSSLEGEFDLVQRIIYEVRHSPLKKPILFWSRNFQYVLEVENNIPPSILFTNFLNNRLRIPVSLTMKELLLYIMLSVPDIQRLSSFWFSLASMSMPLIAMAGKCNFYFP